MLITEFENFFQFHRDHGVNLELLHVHVKTRELHVEINLEMFDFLRGK